MGFALVGGNKIDFYRMPVWLEMLFFASMIINPIIAVSAFQFHCEGRYFKNLPLIGKIYCLSVADALAGQNEAAVFQCPFFIFERGHTDGCCGAVRQQRHSLNKRTVRCGLFNPAPAKKCLVFDGRAAACGNQKDCKY